MKTYMISVTFLLIIKFLKDYFEGLKGLQFDN